MTSKRSSPKKTVTLRLPAELVDEFRTLVRDYAGKPHYLTLSSFIETALAEHLKRLTREIEGRSHRDHPSEANSQRR